MILGTRQLTAVTLALALGAAVPSGAARSTPAAPSADRLWSDMTAADVQALSEILTQSHPGAVDPENPAVREGLAQGKAEALKLARRSTSLAGDEFALRYFATRFDDDHVFLYPTLTGGRAQYPGFVVARRGERYVVAKSEEPSVAVGAELLSCDGRDLRTLFDTNVRPFYAVQGIAANEIGFSPYVLADLGNPYIRKPAQCSFRQAGVAREVPLTWRATGRAALLADLHDAAYGASAETGVTEWRPGQFWVGLPSFGVTGDDGAIGANYSELQKTIAAVKASAARLHDAKVIVFDVRGNHGGSAEPGDRMLQAIWGDGFTENLENRRYDHVEWRPSDGNLAALIRYRDSYKALQGPQSELAAYFGHLVDTLEPARQRGEPLVRAGGTQASGRRPEVNPKVILLSNGTCISACLDFADAVLSIRGAEVWGADTGADTIYIENRGQDLPSGLFRVSLPMKLWRGRARGNNEPYRATQRHGEPFGSTSEAQAWVDRKLAFPAP